MTFISYAQNCEDVMLWRALKGVGRGFYVDLGAQHPDVDSVTRAFYDRGWHGVDVEPSAEYAALLRAARPRDVVLELALGDEPGEAEFLDVPSTGLSTTDPGGAERVRELGLPSRTRRVTVSTLADVARRHAAGEVHFLKIDVEGAERAVLAGADLFAFRPWIILVEATVPGTQEPSHADWEPILLAAGYEFAWFDGLNRFYLASERADALRPHFASPPNVFDDFIRSADGAWFSRVAAAETELAVLRADAERGRTEIGRVRQGAERDAHELIRLRELLRDTVAGHRQQSDLQAVVLHQREHELHQMHLRLGDMNDSLGDAYRRLERTHALIHDTESLSRRRLDELTAVQGSHSWKLTAPLRRAGRMAKRLAGGSGGVDGPPAQGTDAVAGTVAPETPDAAAGPSTGAPLDAAVADANIAVAEASLPPLPVSLPPPAAGPAGFRTVTAVHQFHSGSAVGDAITNAMLFTRSILRAAGFASEIFTEQPAAGLEHELKPFELIPRHDRYVLIVRHSMGYDRFDQVLELPARKILLYHNITPPEFLHRHPVLEHYARLGRDQLRAFRGRVEAALADSEYNLVELRRLGIGPAEVCTLLFDVDALRASAAATERVRAADAPFTVLFVGRVVESKNQLLLVDAFARFRAAFGGPCRLVLAGRHEGEADPYLRAIRARIAALDLVEAVELTGSLDDEALRRRYAAADLYVSASLHEGFGVPLVEAMAHGIPVLAWPAGAVAYTLAGAARLLPDLHPDAIARAMLELARDPEARDRQRRNQEASIARFAPAVQETVLLRALLRAGAEPPTPATGQAALRENLRVTVCGHVNGSYSLAVINRELARQLERAMPGRVRLQPVEGGPTAVLSAVPAAEREAIAALASRPPHATGPELVISQHYPVHLPDPAGDVPVALLFWEESLLPRATIETVSSGFAAVAAPSRFVQRALLDSGCSIPVRVVPPAVDLSRFAALRGRPRSGDGPYRFLHVSSCFPRKGIDVLLRAWARAFAADAPVRLVVKSFPNPHNEVAEQIAALRREHPAIAPIELVDRDLDEAELLALYADADAMVLPTRGEGLNLPAAEAMAAGLALIVTDGGGHMDFCADAEGVALPGVRLLPSRPERSRSHLASAHSVWLEPDEDALVAALREQAGGDHAGSGHDRDPHGSPPPAFPSADDIGRRFADLAVNVILSGDALSRPVRMSWISTWNLRCGVSEYSRQLLAAIDGRAGASGPAPQIRVLCDRRTPVAEPDARSRYWPCWEIGDPRSVEPLAAAIASDDPDAVVIQHQPGLLPFPVLAALLRHPVMAGRTVTTTLHNTRHLLDLPDGDRADALDGLRRLDRVVVHTLDDLHRLRDLGMTGSVMLLPQGVDVPPGFEDPPRIRELRADPTAPTGDLTGTGPLIGCYGFLLPGKGIDTLIEAFAVLRNRWPDARLALVNALYDHPDSHAELRRCQALIAEHRLDRAVMLQPDFLPHAESLRLLRSCDVVALPYRPSKEASSAALRGAMASGVPVAVTDIPLFDEAGEAVFRFGGMTPRDVAAGLDHLLDHRGRREALAAAAEQWLAARSWDDVAYRLTGMVSGLVRTRLLGGS
ncbi:MAG: FkbM family methyltransferase [Gluconacetobacter diazotrophicus]|nr:FkbM family methyltransferase [Gluconacetobacter diazotrophicus]